MGLIKAGIGALGGTLADQWKEFFYCEALENNILMRKGQKRISGRSSAMSVRRHASDSGKASFSSSTDSKNSLFDLSD